MFTLHGIYIALGIFVMLYLTAVRVVKFKSFSVKYLFYIAPFAIALGFILSRLSYVSFCDSLYLTWSDKWKLTDGGYMLYGAIGGAVCAIYAWCIIAGKRYIALSLLDAAAPGAALGICIGRFGSAFYEECYGLFIEDPSLWKLPFSVYISSLDSRCMAVFLYEAVVCLLIMAAVFLAESTYGGKRGSASFHFIVLYAGARTFLESLRQDSIYYGFVRVSQLISALIIIVFFIRYAVKNAGVKKINAVSVLMYIIFAASVTVGFLCEFYMGSDSFIRNYVILGICCTVMTLLTLVMYGMYHINSVEPLWVGRRNKTKLPTRENTESR